MDALAQRQTAWLTDVAPDEMRRIVDALYRVHRLVPDISDLDALLEHIMEESKGIAMAEACSLLLYDDSKDDLYFHVALGESGDQQALKSLVRLKLGEGIAGLCAANRESVNVTDAASDERVFREADKTSRFVSRNMLAVPLVDHDRLIGVLEVLNKKDGNAFTDVDRRIMEVFASLVAGVLTNARLIEQNIQSERLAALGQAVAGLSHYCKNVLTGVSGSVELIDQGIARGDQNVLLRGWSILKRSVGRISNVVEDMLAYSKPRVPLRSPCNVADLFEDISSSMQDAAKVRGIVLEQDCSAVKQPVVLDPRGAYRCLMNLVSNAIDAAPRETGHIIMRAYLDDNGAVVFEVRDNGPGVPDELLDKIFDPFYSTKGSGGTGIGLAVTKKLVLEHGGQALVDRGPEGGARFRLVFPQSLPR